MEVSEVRNNSYILDSGDETSVVVRGDEILILLMVLFLWVFAIILFFHRWGQIRVMEPYQPTYKKEDTLKPKKVSNETEPYQLTCQKEDALKSKKR